MTTVYNCNVCRETKDKCNLIGINFSNMRDFRLAEAHTTDGVHICYKCAGQLNSQLPAWLKANTEEQA